MSESRARLTKLVNGSRVEMTPAEEAAIRAEWEMPAPQGRPVLTAEGLAQILIERRVLSVEDLGLGKSK